VRVMAKPERGASEHVERGPDRASGSLKRPDPVHWLWYAVGGRLPVCEPSALRGPMSGRSESAGPHLLRSRRVASPDR